jgi:tRNA G18 (ribose-2'-O)-methylase SpoU
VKKTSRKSFYVICDNIRSLENIGSIFRTSDALNIDKIFLCGISGKPPSKKISKSALGAEDFIPFEYFFNTWRLIEKLKKEKVYIIALEKTKKSRDYTEINPKFPAAIILGNEVRGVSKPAIKRSDKVIHIPMAGKKESLNVAVAFGVAGYEINKYRNY